MSVRAVAQEEFGGELRRCRRRSAIVPNNRLRVIVLGCHIEPTAGKHGFT
jgi:hypothetical protein